MELERIAALLTVSASDDWPDGGSSSRWLNCRWLRPRGPRGGLLVLLLLAWEGFEIAREVVWRPFELVRDAAGLLDDWLAVIAADNRWLERWMQR